MQQKTDQVPPLRPQSEDLVFSCKHGGEDWAIERRRGGVSQSFRTLPKGPEVGREGAVNIAPRQDIAVGDNHVQVVKDEVTG